MENPKKYLGVGLTYTDGLPYGKKYGLESAIGFGFHTQSCVINERYTELREDINYHIARFEKSWKTSKNMSFILWRI